MLSEKLHFFDRLCFTFLVIATSFVDLQKCFAPFWNRQTILKKNLRLLVPPDGSVILKKCGKPKTFIFFDLLDFTLLVVVTSLVDSQKCYTPFWNWQTIPFTDLLYLMSRDGSVMLKKCGLPKNGIFSTSLSFTFLVIVSLFIILQNCCAPFWNWHTILKKHL